MFSSALQRAYPSTLTDAQWEVLEPLIPPLNAEAAYHKHERRDIVDAILYVLRSGCPWRMLPHDLIPYGTAYDYIRRVAARRSLGSRLGGPAYAGASQSWSRGPAQRCHH